MSTEIINKDWELTIHKIYASSDMYGISHLKQIQLGLQTNRDAQGLARLARLVIELSSSSSYKNEPSSTLYSSTRLYRFARSSIDIEAHSVIEPGLARLQTSRAWARVLVLFSKLAEFEY